MRKNTSGQYLYFTLVGITSGNPVITGASGLISGRKSLDGLSGQIVLSGNIIELGNGGYRANLYDFDTNGDYAGYFFSSSGAVPVTFSIETWGGASGALFLASGQSVAVNSGSLSGQLVSVFSGSLSGQFIRLPSGFAVSLNSGQLVSVFSGQLSGFEVNVHSGQLSGQFTRLLSGTAVNLLSGAAFDIWEQRTGASGTLKARTALGIAAGADLGEFALSGEPADGASFFAAQTMSAVSGFYQDMQVVFTNGANDGVARPISTYNGSGGFTFTYPFPSTPTSGDTFLVRPTLTAASLLSGQTVRVSSGQLSGHQINLLSGRSFPVVPPASLSGVVANSGLFVTATATLASGDVFLASGQAVSLNSGEFVRVYSGQLSGHGVNIQSGQLSGQQVNLLSGNQVQVWSGTNVNTFSGQVNLASGLLTKVAPEALLKYPFSGMTGESPRSLLNVGRKLLNAWNFTTNSGYFTAFKEDGTTEAFTQEVGTASGSPPVGSLGGAA